jgi:hypothetical protein
MKRDINITGARWKSVLNGFRVAGVCCNNNCVRDQRRPASKDAVMMRRKLPLVMLGTSTQSRQTLIPLQP